MRWCALVLYHQSCFSKVWSNGQSTQPRVTPVFSLMRSYCKHLLFAQYANCKGSREGGRLVLIRSMTSRMNLFTLVAPAGFLLWCKFQCLKPPIELIQLVLVGGLCRPLAVLFYSPNLLLHEPSVPGITEFAFNFSYVCQLSLLDGSIEISFCQPEHYFYPQSEGSILNSQLFKALWWHQKKGLITVTTHIHLEHTCSNQYLQKSPEVL